ncbi:bloom syndrome protein [Rhizoctonia solani AG-1 IB]|uniref:DNA 3'-5' helicase n=1 Tax=Thanatephorus cucumeris (strain AG1-IB / isolate 7/3/14) TaxID=1108050 RepID=M5BVV1_THACB|nr:bloom syndrome protein [Rhizoctonia solani AG-1 IB]
MKHIVCLNSATTFDYKKLSILRQLFPNVPITALSATCPPKVLKDLLVTLRMRQVTGGNSANASDTVYFSAPLYRKNLHYSVLPKPASAAAAIQVMADYITQNHAGHSGIVYCLSKKDTETVAEGLSSCSKGTIRTGVYHADIGDYEKESLHIRWRNGEVQVVCATIG